MARFVLRLPTGNLRSFSVHSSSNGAPPGSGSQNGGPMILELPLDKIRRPLMRTRSNDPNKVQELMDSIRQIGLQVPVTLSFWFLVCFQSMCLKLMEFTMVSLVVIGMKLTSALDSQQSVAKFDEEPKKLSGIIFVEWKYMLIQCISQL
ncbi:hypothetical protein ERO13_D12G045700v2 [Gossypium hirsutum]|uniref:Sulfiredoxin, chloroplastic/mitochondrial isoform X1 n=1 Tax=Gossypium hirsutum TaxID=3635 RepID=A0A1U8N9P1_GOSHI|nr:sulfiredoxin, chloroplastic/mitochondrial isoform X1 [Gossypium hirsutum]KAG4114426.1 hypothetical protein ERO13_D12G045700v2 [Gossypium hirsutum]